MEGSGKKGNQNASNQSEVVSCFEVQGHTHSVEKRMKAVVTDLTAPFIKIGCRYKVLSPEFKLLCPILMIGEAALII
jgi:hypothetical protein